MIYPISTYLVACAMVALYGRKTNLGIFGVFCASIFFTPIPVIIGLLLFASDNSAKNTGHTMLPTKEKAGA